MRPFLIFDPAGGGEFEFAVAGLRRDDGHSFTVRLRSSGFPVAEQAAKQHELAEVIGVVVGGQERFAKNRLS